MQMDKRVTLKIHKIVQETKDIKTFTFKHKLDAKPGQFIMLTDFDGGEKPFSISECTEEYFSVTVKRIGEFTTRLFQKEDGDFVSVRGAFGSSFFVSKDKVLLIGGGYAVPTFYFFCKILIESGAHITLVNGARNKDELLFTSRFKKLGINLICTTDDGSFGEKGTVVDAAKRLMQTEQFDFVYVAGPEMMMKAMQPLLTDYNYEFNLERYMKCGIGICGNCTVDPLGIRLCVEGPVLPKKTVEKLTEFGSYHREASGKRTSF
jgi:dihydroorotate dehydrogenase electron transfer subunit